LNAQHLFAFSAVGEMEENVKKRRRESALLVQSERSARRPTSIGSILRRGMDNLGGKEKKEQGLGVFHSVEKQSLSRPTPV